MKHLPTYTDEDLQKFFDGPENGLSLAVLVSQYKALRDHHIAETTLLTSKDRSMLLRMAGNIAGPMSAATFSPPAGVTVKMLREATAKVSIALAREIIDQVDGKVVP